MKATQALCMVMLGVAVLINGCGSLDKFDNARKVADNFFKDRFENGGSGSDEFYSKIFWDNTDAVEWRNIKKLVDLSLGGLESYNLVSWNLHQQLPSSDISGTFAVLVFETRYEKGSGQEKLTLLQRSGLSEFEIVGHQFDSQQINEMVLEGIAKAAEQNA